MRPYEALLLEEHRAITSRRHLRRARIRRNRLLRQIAQRAHDGQAWTRALRARVALPIWFVSTSPVAMGRAGCGRSRRTQLRARRRKRRR